MQKLRNFAAIGLVGALALTGCSSGNKEEVEIVEEPASGSEEVVEETTADGEIVTLVVGASPSPHAQILQYIQENLAEQNGINLDIVEYTDYVQPNEALSFGDLDANYYQTVPYLEEESATRGYDFVSGAGIHLEPLAVYSEKVTSLDELADGAKVGIISDTTNQGRALELLAKNGLVELPESGDVNINTVTKTKNFDFIEIEGRQLGDSLQDVDIAVINGNYAQLAGLAPADAVVIEETEGNPALNVLVWDPNSDKLEAIAKLEEILQSPQIAEYIESQWSDGSVLPANPTK